MKTLIYYTVNYSEIYMDMLQLSIETLRNSGYTGDILIISNMKDKILDRIKTYGLLVHEVPTSNLLHSSANKLLIYSVPESSSYDLFIFADSDTLWLKNPQPIFDVTIHSAKIHFSDENECMSHSLFSGTNLLTEEERNTINNIGIRGLSTGLFSFKKDCLDIFKDIHKFLLDNTGDYCQCLEQGATNVFCYRNNCYVVSLNDFISHWGINDPNKISDRVIHHFAGDPGNGQRKLEFMKSYYDKYNTKSN